MLSEVPWRKRWEGNLWHFSSHTLICYQLRFVVKENKYMRYKAENGPMWTQQWTSWFHEIWGRGVKLKNCVYVCMVLKELMIDIVLCFTWILYKFFCFAARTGLHAKERLWYYAVWNLPVLQASCYQGHVRAYFHDCSSKGELRTLLAYVIGFLILLFSFHCDKFMTFEIFAAVITKNIVFLDVTLCILVDICQHFRGPAKCW
jgi:hypothetical protein